MMDCTDLDFHSQLDGWNVVSFATDYVTVVDDPAKVAMADGERLDPALRGHIVHKLKRNAPDVTEADRAALRSTGKHHPLLVFSDPLTGEPARDAAGRLVSMPLQEKEGATPGLKNLVGWRSNAGFRIAYGGSEDQILDALGSAFPEVNVLRLDFNVSVTRSPRAAKSWVTFAQAAADRGYRIIVQNSDGELAGGFIRSGPSKRHTIARDRLGPPDALSHPDGDWKINGVQDDWEEMLAWFHRPEHASILEAVVGWELINEPMAYGRNEAAGALYSRHMADLISSLDWSGKRILVGGLGASAQFARLDHDLIREAAGDALVWSVHMYPGWVVAPYPDPAGNVFRQRICERIGDLTQEGDDIVVTESQLHTAEGSLDPAGAGKRAVGSYNLARMMPWFADQGIGWTWWPPTSRRSDLLQWNGGEDSGYNVELESAAFAHWGWSRGERDHAPGAAWGSEGDDRMTLAAGSGSDRPMTGVKNPHGLYFGLDGADQIGGRDGTDLLYGGPGTDTVDGGAGDDWLFGDTGADVLTGGAGRDVLIDPAGENTLAGGEGDDHLEGSGMLDGGAGGDVLIAAPSGAATLTGGEGPDRFLPGPAGEVRITDFTRGEDVLDLSLLGGLPRCDLQVVAEAEGLMLSQGELRLKIAGIDALEQSDLLNAGNCRLGTR